MAPEYADVLAAAGRVLLGGLFVAGGTRHFFIADAVTEFTYQRDLSFADRRVQTLNERLGSFAHELRNPVSTATLAFTVIKAGNVGAAGATRAVLDRSLVAMRNLIDGCSDWRLCHTVRVEHQHASCRRAVRASCR